MNVKEISELDIQSLDDETLMLVYSNTSGAGKAYVANIRDSLSEIDDTKTSLKNTWSAKKVYDEIEDAKDNVRLTAGENISISGNEVSMPVKFTKFVVTETVPTVETAEAHVLYLVNTVQDVYTGYYLIENGEGVSNSIGQIGGRQYTGGDGISVDSDTAVITNKLVTEGGTINGDLTISGNIYQQGSSYETHAESLDVKKETIVLRDGAESALVDGEYTGLIAKKYNGTTDGALVFDKTGTARVGDYSESNVDKVFTVYSTDGSNYYSDSDLTASTTIPSGVTLSSGISVRSKYTYTKTETTDTTVKVYSSDGTTFYTDSELTTVATIPDGITPTATGTGNEYSYTVTETSDVIVTVYSSDGVNYYSDTELTISATIPDGTTITLIETVIKYTYTKNVTEAIDDTSPLSTRKEESEMVDGKLTEWNATDKCIQTTSKIYPKKVYLTEAEYNALEAAEEIDDDTIYEISDITGTDFAMVPLDDNKTTTENVWSASKINDALTEYEKKTDLEWKVLENAPSLVKGVTYNFPIVPKEIAFYMNFNNSYDYSYYLTGNIINNIFTSTSSFVNSINNILYTAFIYAVLNDKSLTVSTWRWSPDDRSERDSESVVVYYR